MRGELDWIVMKAIEKDRTRRYETASAFGSRHPALPGRRRRRSLPAVGRVPAEKVRPEEPRGAPDRRLVFAVLLLVGAVLSTWQAIRATRAEAVASSGERAMCGAAVELERDRAVRPRPRRRAEGEKAERSAAEAKAVLGFFQDQVLSAARPEGLEGGLGKDVTIRKAIDVAEPKIAAAFPDQPTIEASVRSVLGETYYYLGEPALAVRQRERALELRMAELGPDHPDTLNLQNSLALAYWAAGQHDRAIPLLEADAGGAFGQARARSPRHAHQPEQPRARLPGRRSSRPGDPAPGADGRGAFGQARAPTTPTRSSARTTSRTPTGLPASLNERSL